MKNSTTIELTSSENGVYLISKRGTIQTTYEKLVLLFGKPIATSDDDKVEAMWKFLFENKIMTIYNWKDSKTYLGNKGKNIEDITQWSVGAVTTASKEIERLQDILNDIPLRGFPIKLSRSQKMVIKTIKNHYSNIWEINCKTWYKSLQKVYSEIYGYKFTNNIEHRYVMFNSLFTIYTIIKEDQSGDERELRNLFHISFHKTISRDEPNPVNRVISELCGLIQCNTVEGRYDLSVVRDDV